MRNRVNSIFHTQMLTCYAKTTPNDFWGHDQQEIVTHGQGVIIMTLTIAILSSSDSPKKRYMRNSLGHKTDLSLSVQK